MAAAPQFAPSRRLGARWIGVWPAVSPVAPLRPRAVDPPFPLAEPGCRLYKRARHGLWHGARRLGVGEGDEVLAPAFHHGCEIEALIRTGARVTFYECDDRLRPDPDMLDSLIGPRVKALHLIHYLGFPQESGYWRQWCDERGLLLFEDAAQSWLAATPEGPVGSFGQLGIYCIYKTLGLGQPGAMICDEPPPAPTAEQRVGTKSLLESHASWLLQRVDLRRLAGTREYVPFAPEAHSEFALGNPDSAPSTVSEFICRRLAGPEIAERRRANYRFLLGYLGERVPSAFRHLPAGASPLQFPVEVANKPCFLERLAALGIGAANAWPLPHPSLPQDRFPRAAHLRATVVGLPVHQGLSETALEQVAYSALSAA